MAKNIKKAGPFPLWLLRTPVSIEFTSGLTEDGEPKKSGTYAEKCMYSCDHRTVTTKDGKEITTAGTLIFNGDIAPDMKDEDIAEGTAIMKQQSYHIVAVKRPTNPDGTVHHTEIEIY